MPEQRLSIPDYIREQALAAGIDPSIALAVAEQESSFRPDAIGPEFEEAPGRKTRAVGLFQLTPSTAARLGVKDLNDPEQNVRGGLQYLKELIEKHQDPTKAFGVYGGVVRNTTYVPNLLAKIEKYKQEQQAAAGGAGAAGAGATGTTTTPRRPGDVRFPSAEDYKAKIPSDAEIKQMTWGQKHPYLDAAVEAFDPNEVEGRQNIAGGIGGALGGGAGGFLGGLLAAPTLVLGPGGVPLEAASVLAGRRIGSAAGSALFGGAEQALVEETGLGKLIADFLPGETNVATPPPDPTSGYWGRVGGATWSQAKNDIAGQVIGKGLGIAGKRLIQSKAGQAAGQYFLDHHATEVKMLYDALDQLNTASVKLKERTANLGRYVTEAMGVTRQAAGDRAATGVADVAAGVTGKVGAARAAADAANQTARLDAAAALRAARSGAVARREGSAAAYESAIGAPPPEIPVGQGVVDTLLGPTPATPGPVQSARRALGEAVEAAAEKGPEVDISAIQAEARRIAERELLPPEVTFPRRVAEAAEEGAAPDVATGVLDASGNPIMRPGAPPAPPPIGIDALHGDISAAQLQETIKQKVMGVISRIMQANPTVPFKDLHLWKSELQRALNYDAAGKTQGEAITQHLTGMMREALGVSPEYNAATAAYAPVAKLFEEGYGPEIARIARSAPEKIVQMISKDDPSSAAMLVDALTTVAEQGGGPEAGAAGRTALAAVQQAWLHRNVLQGGIKTLGERLKGLTPEFRAAFLGNGHAREMLRNFEGIAAQHAKLVKDAQLQIADQLLANETARAATKAAGKQSVQAARDAGAAELRAARDAARTGKRALQGTTADVEEAVRLRGRKKDLAMEAQLRQAHIDLRNGKEFSPEFQRFLDSTLGPKNQRKAEQVAADLINAAMKMPSYWGALGVARLMKGATDRDLLLYAAASPVWLQNFIKHGVASAKPGWAIARISQMGRQVGAHPPKPPLPADATLERDEASPATPQ